MDCKDLRFQLFSGNLMPLIGFGTFQIKGAALIKEVLDYALAAGYRSIDTAYVYNNEEEIGAALKELLPKYSLKRKDIFITSKLPPTHHGDKVSSALNSSLQKLDCEYLDLYLIHWPGQANTAVSSPDNKLMRLKSWKHLKIAQKSGLVRDIGVSNYTLSHMQEISAQFNELPSVNQVEWHPLCHQADLKEFCSKNRIHLQAYSSLGGTQNTKLIDHSTVVTIASKLDKEPAQILLRWALQQNIGIIPKSRSREHVESNIDLNFIIPDEDMNSLSYMQQQRFAWDPSRVS